VSKLSAAETVSKGISDFGDNKRVSADDLEWLSALFASAVTSTGVPGLVFNA